MLANKELLKWLVIALPVIVAKAPDFIKSYSTEKEPDFEEENLGILTKFKVDTSNLTIYKSGNLTVDVSLKSDECYKCAYYSIGQIQSNHNVSSVLVDTRWGTSIKLTSISANCSATFHYAFGEYGHYSVNFSSTESKKGVHSCTVSPVLIVKNPHNSNLPILLAFLILLAVGCFYTFGLWFYKKKTTPSTSQLIDNDFGSVTNAESNEAVQSSQAKPVQQAPRERLKSIDTFRGLCLVIMIFVNYGGGNYWFFTHSPWNGLTVADLVFPWFMFIMGVNITLSVDSLLRKDVSSTQIAYKVVRRTFILFALGVFIINHNTTWSNFRVPGVLQRFAISYLFAFLVQWGFHKSPTALRERAMDDEQPTWWYPARDVFLYWPQWVIVLALEALWLILTFLLPVPGCPTGYLGPGGLADDGQYMNSTCIGGAAGYIDRWMLGEAHIYGHPTAKSVYYPTTTAKAPYDPEGVLGAINGCIIVFLGSQMGKIFLYYERPRSRIVRWLCWGLLLGVISIILCRASANEGWIPVNKNLWTTTFVTTLASFAFILMIVVYLLVDVMQWWSGSPFDFVGMNSILLYVGHETFQSYTPFSWGANEYSTHAEWLAMNMLGVFYWVVIAYYCCKIKFFVKI